MKKKTKLIIIIPFAIIVIPILSLIIMFAVVSKLANELPENNPASYLENMSDRSDRKVIVLIGDSITHGKVSANYADILESRLGNKGYDIVNAGINGDLAYNVLQRLDDIIEINPDFITILVGTNDANGTFYPDKGEKQIEEKDLPGPPTVEGFTDNLSMIVEQLNENTDSKIALLSIPCIGEEPESGIFQHTAMISSIIKDTAQTYDTDYLPLNETLTSLLIEENHVPGISVDTDNMEYIMYRSIFYNYILGFSYDEISRDKLDTIFLCDFLHLNTQAAYIVADLIEGFIISN